MRVLLTGGAGFIGRHVLTELLVRGHSVRVLDSLRPDVHKDGKAAPLDAELLVADVRDAAAIDHALDGVEAVLHLAAKVGLGVDVGDLPDYASSNDTGTAELLAGMAREGIKRLTLASSMVVYGEGFGLCPDHGAVVPAPRIESELKSGNFEPPCPVCGRPLETTLVTEDAPFDPRNAYASSKVAQECTALACHATRLMPASQRFSRRRSDAARRPVYSRMAANSAILSTSATSLPRQSQRVKSTSTAFARSTSARGHRGQSVIWR
jgi:dTDP-L-rhamnose 4-epimerase